MDILVKGMEMPGSCCACYFSSVVPGEVWCKVAHAEIPVEQALGAKRPDCCPLVPVLTPHGDLIDRDAYEYPGDLMDEIVVIPAEPAEEGE